MGYQDLNQYGGYLNGPSSYPSMDYSAGFSPVRPEADYVASGAKVVGGAGTGAALGSSILPGYGTAIGAGIGALTSLYGAYKAQDMAEKNYGLEMEQWRHQQELENEARDRAIAEAKLQNEYQAASYAGNQRDNLLSRYAAYDRGIGR